MPCFWLGIVLMVMLLALARAGCPPRACTRPTAAAGWATSSPTWSCPRSPWPPRPSTIIARLTRSTLLDILGQDFVRTARAKGLVERAVVLRHALKNALIPIVTVVGVQAGYLLGGAVLTETVFAWPGVGTLMVQGILARDFPLVQGCVLVIALVFVFFNLAVDLLYACARSPDPVRVTPPTTVDRGPDRDAPGAPAIASRGRRWPSSRGGRWPRCSRPACPLLDPDAVDTPNRLRPPGDARALRSAPTSSAATCWPAWSGARGSRCWPAWAPPRRRC